MANIPFTSNYTDLSSQRGFQFKFFCGKCANGYVCTFKANRLGSETCAPDLDEEIAAAQLRRRVAEADRPAVRR